MNPVDFQADLDRGRTELQAFAQARMTSTCTIAHRGGTTSAGGIKKTVWTPDYTDHPVRIGGGEGSRTLDVDGLPVTVPVRVASLPIGTSVTDGVVIEITSGDLEGKFFRVVESTGKDQATALRVQVVGIERPDGWS